MKIDKKYGFPIVTAKNVFSVLAQLGFEKWPHIKPPISLDEHLAQDLTRKQLRAVKRYVPKIEVVSLKRPDKELFEGFRWVSKDWASVFVLLGDYVVLVAEYRHGAEVMNVGLPAGAFHKEDAKAKDPMEQCARREFEEETGITLAKLTPLAKKGVVVNTRGTKQYCFPFLGVAKRPISIKPQQLDETEFIEVLLMKIDEWLKFIEQGKAEMNNGNTTLLSLMKLKKIKLLE